VAFGEKHIEIVLEAVRAVNMVVAPWVAYHERCSFLSDVILKRIYAVCRQAVRIASRLPRDALEHLMHDEDVGMGLVDIIATAKAHHVRGTHGSAAATGPGHAIVIGGQSAGHGPDDGAAARHGTQHRAPAPACELGSRGMLAGSPKTCS
jgi:hypothetical protein